ncbi:MAG: diguanylate cyclase [Desulfuromusa sp.]|nr:diguanylate cyclase [Desulfuromusa sp.]
MSLRRIVRANFAFVLLMTLIVLSICGGTAYVIQRLKTTAISQALNESALNARAFEDHLTRSLDKVKDLAEFITAGPAKQTPENIGNFFLRTLRHSPFLRSLSLLDEKGRIVTSSNPANLGLEIPEADYLPPLAGNTYLRVGRPWLGRDFYEGTPSTSERLVEKNDLIFIPLQHQIEVGGRRIRLLAAINPDFFINYFTQWLSPEQGFVDLLRYDMLVLLSTGDHVHPGSLYTGRKLKVLLPEKEIIQFEEMVGSENAAFTAVRATRQYPLLVVTHLRRDSALVGWRKESRRLLLFVGPALFGFLVLSIALYRRQQRLTAQRVEEHQRERERLAATVFDTVSEAVIVTGPDNLIVAVNAGFTRITGYEFTEAVGSDPIQLSGEIQTSEFNQEVGEALSAHGHWTGEIRHRRKNGELFVAWQSINLVRNESGAILYQVTGFSDITEYSEKADRFAWLAHHDPLTGLPNRTLLVDRLSQAIRHSRRSQSRLALIFLDLDKFKPVNDNLGHAVGDKLLQAVGERLLDCVRDSDTVVRLGGDEFVVLLPVMDVPQDAIGVAQKINQTISRPFQLQTHSITISTSCGIAIYPDHGTEEAQLMNCADAAMYRAKESGGDRVQLFNGETHVP